MKEVSEVLIENPLFKPEDLGKAVPGSLHAISGCLPSWHEVIGYEQGSPEVLEKFKIGYPRFLLHPFIRDLNDNVRNSMAVPGEELLVFPTGKSAERAAEFMLLHGADTVRIKPVENSEMYAVVFADKDYKLAKYYWQHAGEIVTSRRAEAYLSGSTDVDIHEFEKSCNQLTNRIANYSHQSAENVYLLPTGMAAIHLSYRIAQILRNENSNGSSMETAQMGFPYVDTRMIQEKFGNNFHFFPNASEADYQRLESLAEKGRLAAVFCEMPANPLLQNMDLHRLGAICLEAGIPLIVDETLATFYNVDVSEYADIIVTSLSKYFSGDGDVMGGSLIVTRRAHSEIYHRIKSVLDEVYENSCFHGDIQVLLENSEDFESRMAKCNSTTAKLVDWISNHPKVEQVYYPSLNDRQYYEQVQHLKGGFGGVFSIVLKGGEEAAERFYDRIKITKAPSLGNNFTMCCPYTLLAHFNELDVVGEYGVSRNLIRISIGQEEFSDLKLRFQDALS